MILFPNTTLLSVHLSCRVYPVRPVPGLEKLVMVFFDRCAITIKALQIATSGPPPNPAQTPVEPRLTGSSLGK